MATAPPLYWPYPPSIVREWPGTRPAGWAPHWGTDFAVSAGTPVPATSDGVIVFAGDDGLGGYTIDLLRSDGLLQRFGHLTWGSQRVQVGTVVKAGQTIALSGYSGAVVPKGPDGAHLHWELRWDRAWSAGKWVDPRTLGPLELGQTPSTPTGQEEEWTMEKYAFRYTKNGIDYVKVFEPTSGWEFDYTTRDTKFNNLMMKTFGFKEIVGVDESIYNAIGRSLAAVRQGK